MQLQDWLESVIQYMSEDLFRYKGIVAVEGLDQKCVFQVPSLPHFLNIVLGG